VAEINFYFLIVYLTGSSSESSCRDHLFNSNNLVDYRLNRMSAVVLSGL